MPEERNEEKNNQKNAIAVVKPLCSAGTADVALPCARSVCMKISGA